MLGTGDWHDHIIIVSPTGLQNRGVCKREKKLNQPSTKLSRMEVVFKFFYLKN